MTVGRRAANTLLGCRWVGVMLLASGCHGRGPSSVIARAARGQVYATVLREIAHEASAPLVLVDTLLPTHDIDAELRDKVLGDLVIPRRALDAFFRVQHAPVDQYHPPRLMEAAWASVSMAHLDSLRALSRGGSESGGDRSVRIDAFWRQWYRAFPGSGGYLVLSPASVRSNDAMAIVHVRIACGPVCGDTELRVLRRDPHGTWRTTSRVRLSES